MTTSEQPQVLEPAELAALRALARGDESTVPSAMCRALAAKGMLAPDGRLTPAGCEAGVRPSSEARDEYGCWMLEFEKVVAVAEAATASSGRQCPTSLLPFRASRGPYAPAMP